MTGFIEMLQNHPLIIFGMFIISVLSGIMTIVKEWRGFYSDVLSKKITLPVYAYLIIIFLIALGYIFWPKPKDRPKQFRTIEGESFGIQRVYIDGKRFVNCNFNGTEMVFTGESGGELIGSKFSRIRLTASGPAAITLNMLRAMYSEEGFRPYIDNLFNDIKTGIIRKATTPSDAADN